MGGLSTYFSIATFLLFAAAVFTLARSDGWSGPGAFGVLGAAIVLPIAVGLFALTNPAPALILEIVLAVCGVIPMLVLFALAKSVSNKLRVQGQIGAEGKSA